MQVKNDSPAERLIFLGGARIERNCTEV